MFGFGKKSCEIVKNGCTFTFKYKGKTVLAPNGRPAESDDENLARAIKAHIDEHGTKMTGESDILSWHYTYQCNFQPMGKLRALETVRDCFVGYNKDVTFVIGAKIKAVADIFGTEKNTVPIIEKWLKGLSTRQLVAVCCIGNAYHSINIARLIASGMSDGWHRIDKDSFANMICRVFPCEKSDVLNDIDLFELYFRIPDVELNSSLKSSLNVPWRDAKGNYRCAGEACPPGLCDSGKCPLDMCTKALCRMEANDYNGAIRMFEKGLAIAPDFANGWTNLAACYGRLGNHRKALECAKKALAADPNYEPAKEIVAVASRNV